MKVIEKLKKDLFRPGETETAGQILFFRLFEFFIAYFVIWFAWFWGVYIPNLGEVLLPLGIANYIDISFMFSDIMGIGNAILITLFVIAGYLRMNKFAYLIAMVLFHFHYAARFSQGEISHGSNMVGAALFSLAIAQIAFSDSAERRKFAVGMLIFFIGLGYVTAAFSKFIGTGPSWVDGSHLWLWIGERSTDMLSQHGHFELNLLQKYILQYHWLATIILFFGLLVELFGWLFWFRKTRPYAATLLISMHVGILLSMNINFPKYVYIMIILGYSWHKFFDYLLEKYEQKQPVQFLLKRYSPETSS